MEPGPKITSASSRLNGSILMNVLIVPAPVNRIIHSYTICYQQQPVGCKAAYHGASSTHLAFLNKYAANLPQKICGCLGISQSAVAHRYLSNFIRNFIELLFPFIKTYNYFIQIFDRRV